MSAGPHQQPGPTNPPTGPQRPDTPQTLAYAATPATGYGASRLVGRITVYVLLTLGAIVLLFPLYWMITVSLLPADQAMSAAAGGESLALVPDAPQWENYPASMRRMGTGALHTFNLGLVTITLGAGFLDAFANTVVVTVLSVIGQVFSCSLVGYAFARLRFRGREPTFIVMVSTMMLPPQVTMIPLFILFRWLGWVDTFLPLIVPLFFGNPFFIFMFRQFFAQIPEALVEAARIDGCGYFVTWWRIMLPLCRPVIAITAIFTFMFVWNDFLGPLIYLHSEYNYTLAIALNSFRNQYGGVNDVHLLMAISVITMLPCVILFFVAQRHFVGGLSLGAVKG